jgi:Glycosyl hydrolase family 9/Cellulase N-terminal ig-like domain
MFPRWYFPRFSLWSSISLLCLFLAQGHAESLIDDTQPLRMPAVGDHQLRIITPTLLELTLITTKAPDPATVTQWNFVDGNGNAALPGNSEFAVTANSQSIPVQSVGFRCRPLYAPLKHRDLRIINCLYLKLSSAIPTGALVQVRNPSMALWTNNVGFSATADPQRYSPVIHANQVGYVPSLPKKAMVGYYLGSLGELNLSAYNTFQLVDAQTGATVFNGSLVAHPDKGYLYTPTPYQQVLEADFSSFSTPGEYKLLVPGLGTSFPFLIDEGVAGTFARTYELGIYHQRCGTNNVVPYSRFLHQNCHTNLVEVPTMASPEAAFVNGVLNNESLSAANNPLHTAPRMTNIAACLYPAIKSGPLNLTGGHHDAGDYSKYTINVAAFVHLLVFAVDAFPGVKDLDNLGIPESGDGISDLIQEAKWEADFLANLQDTDGGFFFIVYPRTRQYESNVLPDQGDLQLVLPKNTSATAAAVGALAEIASSPAFKAAYPVAASNYLAKAKAGWDFLQRAINKYGRNGSYQMITQYGDTFMHNDELAWAAAAMFAATGDPVYDNDLRTNTPNPNDPSLRRWNWWSMFEAYGCAFRTYAFAARTGRLQWSQLNSNYLAKCEAEVKTAGTNCLVWSRDNAYGSSFSDENKGIRTAGWYFSGEETFDVATAYLLDPRPEYIDVILKNFNYEMGCNPVNVSYLTGVGWRRQREIVHQYAQNDFRTLPPSGIPLGNIQQGSYWVETYKSELAEVTFPADSANSAPYPMYDRWADAFNVMTEFVVSRQSAKMVATASWLMAMTHLKTQAWNSATAQITGIPSQNPVDQPVTARLSVRGLDLSKARIVWEALGQEPQIGSTFSFTPANIGNNWVEVEAQLPDGRRVVAVTNMFATMSEVVTTPMETNSDMVALYRLNTDLSDAMHREPNLTTEGNATLDPVGLHVQGIGNDVTVSIPNAHLIQTNLTKAISVEAKLYINSFNTTGIGTATMLSLQKAWNVQLLLQQDKWKPRPDLLGGTQIILDGTNFVSALSLQNWHVVNITLTNAGYIFSVDGKQIFQNSSADFKNWIGSGSVVLRAGNFDGWIRDLVVRNIQSTNGPPIPPTTPAGPRLTSLRLSPEGEYQLRFNNTTNTPYVIEVSTDLQHWQPIYTHYFGGLMEYIDGVSPNYLSRFYRVRYLDTHLTTEWLPPDDNGESQIFVNAPDSIPYVIQVSTNSVNWTSVYTNVYGSSMIYSNTVSANNVVSIYRAIIPDLRPSLSAPALDMWGLGIQVLRINSLTSAPYILQTSTNCVNWNSIFTNSYGGTYEYWDVGGTNQSKRFYRAVIQTSGIRGYY